MLTRKEFLKFLALTRRRRPRERLRVMCLDSYLGTVSIAYAAMFADADWLMSVSRHTRFKLAILEHEGITPENLPACSPRDQYRALSDGRHGGLLDLPPHDPAAFADWYFGNARQGQHPYEVIAGDEAHGVMLTTDPVLESRENWGFELSVHVPHLYGLSVRIALALSGARIPFQFRDAERVIGGLVMRRERGCFRWHQGS